MTQESALEIGRLIIETARHDGYLTGELAVVIELAEEEKALFVRMFGELNRHLERERREHLTLDEISSLFTFVCAKSAEMLTNFVNQQSEDLSLHGMFDGKVPVYAADELTAFFHRCQWPTAAATAFVDRESGVREAAPLLALFEALKWTFRIALHLGVRRLEELGKF